MKVGLGVKDETGAKDPNSEGSESLFWKLFFGRFACGVKMRFGGVNVAGELDHALAWQHRTT